MLQAQVVVLAKAPLAGRSKTRLCPALTPQQAADVAAAALLDTLDAVGGLDVRRRLLVLDGSPEGLERKDFDVLPQRGDGLDERLAWAFDDAFADCAVPTLLIGMDSPQVTTALLEDSLSRLLRSDAVLGPATDGGWWALGLQAPDPQVLLGVPMSLDDTRAHQERRLRSRGLDPVLLPELRDIDRVDDLAAVAAQMPSTSRVARLALQLLESAA